MGTEEFINNNNIYEVPKVNNQEIESVLDTIQKNKETYKDMELHPSIINAQIEQILFLGRLKRLNEDMQYEDEKLGYLLRDIVSTILNKPIEGDIGLDQYLEGTNVDKKIIDEVNKILDKYLGKSIGERFIKSLEGQSNERLKLWNHKHYMTTMTRATGDLFSGESELEARHTDSIGTIFFDLDGLKAINDRGLEGYEAGDKALQAMADALCNKELKKWAASQNVDLIPTHHHGDEFLLGIVGEKDIDLTMVHNNFKGVDGEEIEGMSLIKYIGEYVNKTIEKSPVDEMLDFSNQKQLDKFKDFQDNLPEGLILDKNFKYKLSCSYGYATLRDGITCSVEDGFDFSGNKPNGDKIDWEYSIFKLVGKGLIGTSEAKLKLSKEQGKKRRLNSDNHDDRLLEMIYRFGRESENEKKHIQIIKDLKERAKIIEREKEAFIMELDLLRKKAKREKKMFDNIIKRRKYAREIVAKQDINRLLKQINENKK